MLPTAELIAAMDEWFPPSTAQSWDAVGLVCGDPTELTERVVLAVDPTPDTVSEAINAGAGLLITHHPLLLSGVHGVPTTTPKGALVHRLIRAGVAHLVAHTNADVARPGVSDALAARLGLQDLVSLDASSPTALEKLAVFVPVPDVERVIDALAAAGAGAIGDYDRCAWTSQGIGTFRPLAGANPAIGTQGIIEHVAEARVEMVLPAARRDAVLAALLAVHPYEEPAYDVLTLANGRPDGTGTGRVGVLASTISAAEFVALAAASLPATHWGVRAAAGSPDRPVRTVAVCGGSGGGYADLARAAGADAYLTADLRHHSALEAVTERGRDAMVLVDAAHWATESPWLDELAVRLSNRFGDSVTPIVSRTITDPWTMHVPQSPEPESGPQ